MQFRELLFRGRKTLTVEYNPPKGHSIKTDKIDNAKKFTDAINITDCPMSNLRMNSIASSFIIQQKLGISAIFNLTCRDRNALAVSSDLLGAWGLGLKNILAVNGDAVMDNFSENVYKINTYGLIDIVKNLNNGIDYRGGVIKDKTNFFIGAASNIPKKISIKGIANRLKKKSAFGAEFIITQPVYSIESLEYFLEASEGTNMFKIIGFFPPPSMKAARYLDNFVKGIDIPVKLFEYFKDAQDEKQAGFGFIENLLEDIVKRGYLKHINGVHLMRFDENFVKHIAKIVKGER